METLEKPKRTRRKKPRPPFSHLYNTEGIETIKDNTHSVNNFMGEEDNFSGELVVTPYSEYIPITYLFNNKAYIHHYGKNSYTINNQIQRIPFLNKLSLNIQMNIRDRIIGYNNTSILRDIILDTYKRKNIQKVIEEVLLEDTPLPIEEICNAGYRIQRLYRIRTAFVNSVSYRMYTTGYSGRVSRGFIALRQVGGTGAMIPTIVMAIPRENYLYVKLNWIITGEVDLTKCVIFVDRDLDYADYSPLSFRNGVYKKEIKPYIESLKCHIWKVPTSFIKEKCFLGDYKMRAKTLKGIKTEKDEMVDTFCNMLKKKYSGEGGTYTVDIEHNIHPPDLQTTVWNSNTTSNASEGILSQIRAQAPAPQPYTITVGQSAFQMFNEAIQQEAALRELGIPQEREEESLVDDEEEGFIESPEEINRTEVDDDFGELEF